MQSVPFLPCIQWPYIYNLHGLFCIGLGDSCWGLEVGDLVDESSGVVQLLGINWMELME